MAIWQAMKGTAPDPKQDWNFRDLSHQHFTESMGKKFSHRVLKDDLLLIYWPGVKLYMGLQWAAEDGPHELPKSVPGATNWPWGLQVNQSRHIWIPDPAQGITLYEAKSHIGDSIPGRAGLASTNSWDLAGRDWIIREIKERGEDPQKWHW